MVKIGPKHTNEQFFLYGATQRDKENGIEMTLTIDDIKIPTQCPILGVRLRRGTRTEKNCSPSLDRVNPYLGYTKENVQVISWLANKIKSSATAHELETIADYMRKNMT